MRGDTSHLCRGARDLAVRLQKGPRTYQRLGLAFMQATYLSPRAIAAWKLSYVESDLRFTNLRLTGSQSAVGELHAGQSLSKRSQTQTKRGMPL